MKCPGCQFVSSDQRDICPKCLLDLRAHKQVMGITVTNPDFTYDQLLAKAVGKSKKKSSEKTSLFKSLTGIFSTSEKKLSEKKPAASSTSIPPEPHPDQQKEVLEQTNSQEVAYANANIISDPKESLESPSEEEPTSQEPSREITATTIKKKQSFFGHLFSGSDNEPSADTSLPTESLTNPVDEDETENLEAIPAAEVVSAAEDSREISIEVSQEETPEVTEEPEQTDDDDVAGFSAPPLDQVAPHRSSIFAGLFGKKNDFSLEETTEELSDDNAETPIAAASFATDEVTTESSESCSQGDFTEAEMATPEPGSSSKTSILAGLFNRDDETNQSVQATDENELDEVEFIETVPEIQAIVAESTQPIHQENATNNEVTMATPEVPTARKESIFESLFGKKSPTPDVDGNESSTIFESQTDEAIEPTSDLLESGDIPPLASSLVEATVAEDSDQNFEPKVPEQEIPVDIPPRKDRDLSFYQEIKGIEKDFKPGFFGKKPVLAPAQLFLALYGKLVPAPTKVEATLSDVDATSASADLQLELCFDRIEEPEILRDESELFFYEDIKLLEKIDHGFLARFRSKKDLEQPVQLYLRLYGEAISAPRHTIDSEQSVTTETSSIYEQFELDFSKREPEADEDSTISDFVELVTVSEDSEPTVQEAEPTPLETTPLQSVNRIRPGGFIFDSAEEAFETDLPFDAESLDEFPYEAEEADSLPLEALQSVAVAAVDVPPASETAFHDEQERSDREHLSEAGLDTAVSQAVEWLEPSPEPVHYDSLQSDYPQELAQAETSAENSPAEHISETVHPISALEPNFSHFIPVESVSPEDASVFSSIEEEGNRAELNASDLEELAETTAMEIAPNSTTPDFTDDSRMFSPVAEVENSSVEQISEIIISDSAPEPNFSHFTPAESTTPEDASVFSSIEEEEHSTELEEADLEELTETTAMEIAPNSTTPDFADSSRMFSPVPEVENSSVEQISEIIISDSAPEPNFSHFIPVESVSPEDASVFSSIEEEENSTELNETDLEELAESTATATEITSTPAVSDLADVSRMFSSIAEAAGETGIIAATLSESVQDESEIDIDIVFDDDDDESESEFEPEQPVTTRSAEVYMSDASGQQVLVQQSLATPAFREEILSLFHTAETDIVNSEECFEIGLSPDFSGVEREKILLLFDLAQDYFVEPEIESRYIEVERDTATVKIDNSYLEQTLEQTEKKMSSPLFSLKKGNVLSPEGDEATSKTSIELVPIIKPDASQYLTALVVDFLSIGIWSLVLLVFYLKWYEPYYWSLLREQGSPGAGDSIALFSMVLTAITLGLTSYLFVFFTCFHSTFGMDVGRLQVVHVTGRRLSAGEHAVRSVIVAGSTLFLGWLPAVMNKRQLHDLLANSITVAIAEEPELSESK